MLPNNYLIPCQSSRKNPGLFLTVYNELRPTVHLSRAVFPVLDHTLTSLWFLLLHPTHEMRVLSLFNANPIQCQQTSRRTTIVYLVFWSWTMDDVKVAVSSYLQTSMIPSAIWSSHIHARTSHINPFRSFRPSPVRTFETVIPALYDSWLVLTNSQVSSWRILRLLFARNSQFWRMFHYHT